MRKIILLNQDNKFHAHIDFKQALSLIRRKVVEVVKYSDKVVRTIEEEIRLPIIMRLLKFINYVYKKARSYKKEFVFLRDDYACQYCGAVTGPHTVDHVVPKARGGKSTYENCVTACQECNHRKRNRTPQEAGLNLMRKPFSPSVSYVRRKENEDVENKINTLLATI